MLHLSYFESLLEQHGICYGCKIGPRMVGIQVGYNKNYHKSEMDAMINLILDNCFEILEVVILESC